MAAFALPEVSEASLRLGNGGRAQMNNDQDRSGCQETTRSPTSVWAECQQHADQERAVGTEAQVLEAYSSLWPKLGYDLL